MRRPRLAIPSILAAILVAGDPSALLAQMPLAPVRASGQTVTPAFEGWYENPDGTYSLSFGYFNRNADQVVEIPLGPDNVLEPAWIAGLQADGLQPEHFEPRRHWGVFTVTVPPDFGDRRVTWTLRMHGETFAIPGSLAPDWQIDALAGEAGSGNTPPVVRFAAAGPEGQGPGGVTTGPLRVRVGEPLPLTVWARDDGRPSGSIVGSGREGAPVTLTWLEHSGPGRVAFSQPEAEVPASGGEAAVDATFDRPGDYVLRVRANDASGVAGAGHAQCCWTNGFVKVTVVP